MKNYSVNTPDYVTETNNTTDRTNSRFKKKLWCFLISLCLIAPSCNTTTTTEDLLKAEIKVEKADVTLSKLIEEYTKAGIEFNNYLASVENYRKENPNEYKKNKLTILETKYGLYRVVVVADKEIRKAAKKKGKLKEEKIKMIPKLDEDFPPDTPIDINRWNGLCDTE